MATKSDFASGFASGFATIGGQVHEVHATQEDARARAIEVLADAARTDDDEVTLVHRGESVLLSPAVLEALALVAHALSTGQSVAVVTGHPDREIGSQKAADILNVSRPHVVKLAHDGTLPYRKVGNRHRFKYSDVLAYDRQESARRREVLASIAPAEGYSDADF